MLDRIMMMSALENTPDDSTPHYLKNLTPMNVPGAPRESQTVDICIKALIKAQGKIKLAVEDLQSEHPELGISEEEYALLLVRNKTALYEAVQAISLLHTFDNFVFASTLMKSALGEMPAADIGKTYTSMLTAIKDVTTPKTGGISLNNTQNNFNLEQKIMEDLPPHVVSALQLIKSANNGAIEVIDGSVEEEGVPAPEFMYPFGAQTDGDGDNDV